MEPIISLRNSGGFRQKNGNFVFLHLTDNATIASEILKRVKEFNYLPTKKEAQYSEGLLKEYMLWEKNHAQD